MSTNPKLKVIEGHAYATSIDLAKHFNKRHDDVLRAIRNLISEISLRKITESNDFSLVNFDKSTYKNSRGQILPSFNLTRDAFSLVAMGFTGKEALIWKIKYITAFNEMESELRAKKFHSTQNAQLKLFPEFNDAVSEERPAMPIRFCYEQMIRKGVPAVTPATIRRMIGRGELEAYKANGFWFVYEDSFARYLKDRKL